MSSSQIFLSILFIFFLACWKPADCNEFFSFYGDQMVTSTADQKSDIFKPMEFVVWSGKKNSQIMHVDYDTEAGTRMTGLSVRVKNGILQMVVTSSTSSVHNICEDVAIHGPNWRLKTSLQEDGKFDASINGTSCDRHTFKWLSKSANFTVKHTFGNYANLEKKLSFVGCLSASRDGHNIFKNSPENVNIFNRFYNKPQKGCDPIFQAESIVLKSAKSSIKINGLLASTDPTTILKLNFLPFKLSKGRLFMLNFMSTILTGDLLLKNATYDFCFARNGPITSAKKCIALNSEYFTFELHWKTKSLILYIGGKEFSRISYRLFVPRTFSEEFKFIFGRSQKADSVTGKLKKVSVLNEPLNVGTHPESFNDLMIDHFPDPIPCLEAHLRVTKFLSRSVSVEFKCWQCDESEGRNYIRRNPPVNNTILSEFYFNMTFTNLDFWKGASFLFQKPFQHYIYLPTSGELRYKQFLRSDLSHSYMNALMKLTDSKGKSTFQVIEMITKVTAKKFKILLPHGSEIGVLDLNWLKINSDIIDVSDKDAIDEDLRKNLICHAKYDKRSNQNDTFPVFLIFSFGEILDGSVLFAPPISTPSKSHDFYFEDIKIDLVCKYNDFDIKTFKLSIFPVKRNVTVATNNVVKAIFLTPVKITNETLRTVEEDYFGKKINTEFTILSLPIHGTLRHFLKNLKVGDIVTQNDIDNATIEYTPTEYKLHDGFKIQLRDDFKRNEKISPARLEIEIKISIQLLTLRTNDIYITGSDQYTITAREISAFPEIPNYSLKYHMGEYPIYGDVFYSSINATKPDIAHEFTANDLASGRVYYQTVCHHISDQPIFNESFEVALKDGNGLIYSRSIINIFLEVGSQPVVSEIPSFNLHKELHLIRTNEKTSFKFMPPITISENQLASVGSHDKYDFSYYLTRLPSYDKFVEISKYNTKEVQEMSRVEFLNYIQPNWRKRIYGFRSVELKRKEVHYFTRVKTPAKGVIDSFNLLLYARPRNYLSNKFFCFSGNIDVYLT